MVDESEPGGWTRSLRARTGTRALLGALFALSLVAALVSTASYDAGFLLFQVVLALCLLSRGILGEASGAPPLIGLIYLLLVGLCPFLPQLLTQVLGGPLEARPLLYLCLGLSAIIALHGLTLSLMEIKVGDAGISFKRFLRKPLVIDWRDVQTVECRVVNRMDSSGIA